MARPKKHVEEMTPLGFRLPNHLIDRLDVYRERAALPGMVLSRSDAIRVLLESALAGEGLPAEPKPAKRK